MADDLNPDPNLTSLGVPGAKTLATVTKTPPQMRGMTTRWLLRLLPWVQTAGGVYRVNRRRVVRIDGGRVPFTGTGDEIQIVPLGMRALPMFRYFEDDAILTALEALLVKQDFAADAKIVDAGDPVNSVVLIAHGKVEKQGIGEYGEDIVLELLGGGDFFGDHVKTDPAEVWDFTAMALTPTTVFTLAQDAFANFLANNPTLQDHIDAYVASLDTPQNVDGEALINIASGHTGELALDGTFVSYDLGPREYELSVAQTVLRVHTRVADLYNDPMNQTEQQLRLTIEALRERQEHELINDTDFGLLHNAEVSQRTYSEAGPPTPDDFDRLLELVWKEPSFFLAHPKTISTFGNECSRRGVYPASVDMLGHQVPAWRGVPIFPCNKIPINPSTRTSSVMLMRTGEHNRGVVGLHQTGIPDEVEPSLSVRFMGIDEKAVISYLVSTYYSAAVLVPDALAILEDVQLGSIPPA